MEDLRSACQGSSETLLNAPGGGKFFHGEAHRKTSQGSAPAAVGTAVNLSVYRPFSVSACFPCASATWQHTAPRLSRLLPLALGKTRSVFTPANTHKTHQPEHNATFDTHIQPSFSEHPKFEHKPELYNLLRHTLAHYHYLHLFAL